MKTRISLIILLVMSVLALVLIPSAFAQDGVFISTNNAVNVRSGAGLSYTIRGVLEDTSAQATARSDFDASRNCTSTFADLDMWVRISFNGLEGWVSRCAVSVDSGSVSALPVAQSNNAVLAEEVGRQRTIFTSRFDQPESDYVIGVARGHVNVRTAPNLEAAVLGVARPNEDFFVIGRTGDSAWVQVVLTSDENAWIASYLMTMPTNWERLVPVK
ncbi:MAG: hypothetical protein OHK0046_29650 [Anaerolineae bacterium]